MAREISVIDQIIWSIENKKNYVLDAGAGSGKTFCLIQTLEYLMKKKLKSNQKILCVTFTNVAKDEIASRIVDKTDKIVVSTLHDFIWDFIKQFKSELQKNIEVLARENILKLRNEVSEAERKISKPRSNTNIEKQKEIIVKNNKRLEKYENIDYKTIKVDYDAYSAYYRGKITHDDVITIFNDFLNNKFFKDLFLESFPYILIDEYQDTNITTIENLLKATLDNNGDVKTVIGMYGDRMQMIYEKSTIEANDYSIIQIQKKDNFRTAMPIVESINKFRNDGLIQNTSAQNPKKQFEEIKFIFNKSKDQNLADFLGSEKFEKYKRLYLANKNIAEEVGFEKIRQVFYETYNRNGNEKLRKLDDQLINYIMKNIVYLVIQFENHNFYEIIQKIKVFTKQNLKSFFNEMSEQFVGSNHTIKEYINFFIDKEIINEKEFNDICDSYEDFDEGFVNNLLEINIQEYINLNRQINDETSLDTMHGVKGKEFNRVIINIFENQKWNEYNFDKLILHEDLSRGSVEKAHKLLYVACTRATNSLIINYIADTSSNIDIRILEINIKKHFGELIEFIVL